MQLGSALLGGSTDLFPRCGFKPLGFHGARSMITLIYPDPRVAAEGRDGTEWFRGDVQAPKIKGHKVTYRHYKIAKWKRE